MNASGRPIATAAAMLPAARTISRPPTVYRATPAANAVAITTMQATAAGPRVAKRSAEDAGSRANAGAAAMAAAPTGTITGAS